MRKLLLRLLERWQKRLNEKESVMTKKEVDKIIDTFYRLMGQDEVETLVNSADLPIKKSECEK